jgi:diguanylate cyclase (GGDEF)-like protein/PAS domain S-box-containing protein
MRYTGRFTNTLITIFIFVIFLTMSYPYLLMRLIYWHLGIAFLLSLPAWYLGFYYDKTKFLSMRDELTNIYNRSYIYKVLPKLIARMKRKKYEMSITILDLDDLKTINDTEGHHKGDDLLKRISQLIQSNIRESDIFARWGGDEFIIVSPFTSYGQMNTMVDNIMHIQNPEKIHFSFGISCYPNDALDFNELLKIADERLYKMKESKKEVENLCSTPTSVDTLHAVAYQKQIDGLLLENEKRYKRLLKFLPEPIIIHSEGEILFVNKAAVYLLKAEAEAELIGRSIFDFLHPENHVDARRIIQQVMQDSEASKFEKRRICCITGELIETEVSTIRIDRFNDDNPVILSVFRDMMEKKKSEELLIQSDKLSIIGQLAAGVAHEIRNPLTSLMGFTQVLKSKFPGQETSYFDIMQQELDRINLIVNDFMTLAKPNLHEFNNGSIIEILKNVISILETQAIMMNVNIKVKYIGEVPYIYCDENQLKQVFMNIIKNAIEAMPEGGDVTITIKEMKSEKLHIQIKDQGIGIPDTLIERIGQPFFTTKQSGTGLGLMITQRIIEAHQGSIHISSNDQIGTTVDIYLPNISQLTINDV